MAASTVSVDQVLELIDKLPDNGKRAVRRALWMERENWWRKQAKRGEKDMRRLAADRGLDWDAMSEDDREAFVNALLHEPD